MTSQLASNNSSTTSLQAAWLAHKRARGSPPKAVPSRYDAECVISYVPVGGVYRGHREIETLLEQMRTAYFYFDAPEVLSTVYSENTVIEEALLTIRHEQAIDYLLPGIKATDRTLTCAMCTVSTFRGDKLLSQRVYWDHASMLRQAGILPQSVRGRNGSEVPLKVAGNDVANVMKAAFAPVGEETWHGDSKSASQADAAQSSEVKAPLSDVNANANAAGVTEPDAHSVETTADSATTPEPYGGAEVNVADRSNPVTGQRQSVRLYAPPGGVSQLSLGQSANFNTSPNSFESPSRHRNVPRTPSQSDAFENVHASDGSAATRNAHAARNRGSIGFGSENEPVAAARTGGARPATASEPPQQQQQQQQQQAPGAPPVTGSRVSVRLFAPPGGNSQITFG
ncbi:hypothetical protein HDU88_005348 [Geranomyces variabilis]|nr:hypothetical protein HDU88_005348 [Geranomyces variabilis]